MNTNPIIYEPFSFEKQTFKCISYNETEFIMDWTMEPGGKVPTHTHEFSDEYFFITRGNVKFTVNGVTIFKKAGFIKTERVIMDGSLTCHLYIKEANEHTIENFCSRSPRNGR